MQFIDLGAQYKRIKPQLDKALIDTVEAGRYIMGPVVTDLEKRLADYVGRKYCISCSNGTDALTMPLMAMEIGKGDAVFVPDFTFFASAEVVAGVGATPVFVDVNPDTYNMDPDALEAAIIKVNKQGKLNPKMIISVDLFGQPAQYDRITEIAEKYSLKIMEDGAQGFGGTFKGKRSCSFGYVSTTSFFPAKPLGCYGDGGAVFTDDEELATVMRSIRIHGSNPADKYDNIRLGLNARLDTIQAAVINCKLDIFDSELIARQQASEKYAEALEGVVKTPIVPKDFTSSWAQYTVQLESKEQRAQVMAKLKESGIPSMVYYPKPMHLQTAFKRYGGKLGEFPVAEKLCNTVMSLPMHPYLDDETILTVTAALKKAIEK